MAAAEGNSRSCHSSLRGKRYRSRRQRRNENIPGGVSARLTKRGSLTEEKLACGATAAAAWLREALACGVFRRALKAACAAKKCAIEAGAAKQRSR